MKLLAFADSMSALHTTRHTVGSYQPEEPMLGVRITGNPPAPPVYGGVPYRIKWRNVQIAPEEPVLGFEITENPTSSADSMSALLTTRYIDKFTTVQQLRESYRRRLFTDVPYKNGFRMSDRKPSRADWVDL